MNILLETPSYAHKIVFFVSANEMGQCVVLRGVVMHQFEFHSPDNDSNVWALGIRRY